MGSIVLKSLSVLLGLFFIFVGFIKLSSYISKDLHKDLVSWIFFELHNIVEIFSRWQCALKPRTIRIYLNRRITEINCFHLYSENASVLLLHLFPFRCLLISRSGTFPTRIHFCYAFPSVCLRCLRLEKKKI